MSLSNKLLINGSRELLENIRETHFRNGLLDFNTVIAVPQDLVDEDVREDDYLFMYFMSEDFFVLEPYFPGLDKCHDDLEQGLEFLAQEGYHDFRNRVLRKMYLQETYGNYTAATWKMHNWGPFIEPYDGSIEALSFSDESSWILARFVTKDSPAVQAIATLSSRYPEAFFCYYYPDNDGIHIRETVYEKGLEVSRRTFIKSAMERMISRGGVSLPETGVQLSF